MNNKMHIDQLFYKKNKLSMPSELFSAQVDIFYFAKSREGRFVGANGLMLEHFDVKSVSEFIGKSDFDLFRMGIAQQFRLDDTKIMNGGVGIRGKIELVPDSAGDVNWFITTKTPLRNNDGNIVGIEGLTRDIHRTKNTTEPYSEFKNCINFIQKNYMNNINIQELSDISFMSISTFERRFKNHFGSTPSQYVKRLRIHKACDFLLAGYRTQQIALDCGFCDQSYFTKQFRLTMGMTPRQFKLSHQR